MNRNITIDAQHESATDAVLLKGRTKLESTQDGIAADYVSRSQEKVVVHEVQSHADMVSSNMDIDFLLAHGHDDAQLERCSAPNRRKGVKQNAEVLGLMRAELERTEQEHAELERAVRAAWMCVERARIDLERSERTHAGVYRAMEVAWARVKFSREELAANTAPPSSDNERQRHETFNKRVSERQLAAQELTEPHELTTTMEVGESSAQERAANDLAAEKRAAEERETHEHADRNRKEQAMRNGDVRLAILTDILRRTRVSDQTRIFMTQILYDDRVTTALPQLRSPIVSSMFQEIIAECVSRRRHLHCEVIRNLIRDRCFCEHRDLEALKDVKIFTVEEFADRALNEQLDLLAYLKDARDGVTCSSFDRPAAGMVYDHVKWQLDVIAPPSALPHNQASARHLLAEVAQERVYHGHETAAVMRNATNVARKAHREHNSSEKCATRSADNSPPGESDVRVAILAAVHRESRGEISQTMNHSMAEILYDERVSEALPQLRSSQLSMMFQEVIAECISHQRPLYSEATFDLIRHRYFLNARHLQVLDGLRIATVEEFADQMWEGQRNLLAFLKSAHDGVIGRSAQTSESVPQRPYDHNAAKMLYESVKRQVDVLFLSSLSKRPSRGATSSHKLDYGQQVQLQREQQRWEQRLEQQRQEQQRQEQQRQEQQRQEQQRLEQQRSQQGTLSKGGQFTPGGGRAPAGGVCRNNNHHVEDDDEDDLGTAYVSVTPKFYKGGQFLPGGGRAPADGVWM
ncbi:Hypothetical protein, putative [Bodo saltans]|uniref:Uncharacterized protein n=1 Tax=Bodo saltans TaxID=75058 RepID=A0A0S4J171_BODSA|nr:Hypothetical protein, putative [Bodo saltans]|eukprot:CUG80790.1 Hypothetical protein, putative [Bodo saltans]